MRSLHVALVAAAALVAAGCAAKLPEGKAHVSGHIAVTGATDLSGIVVTLVGPTSHAATTDASGAYSFEKVLDGSYSVIAAAHSTVEGTVSAPVTVSAGADAVAADLAFTGLGQVKGRATLGATAGNAGITVAVLGTAAAGITDDAGNYVIGYVPAGAQKLQAARPGYGSVTATVDVAWAGSGEAPLLKLEPGYTAGGSLNGKATFTGLSTHAGIVISLSGLVSAVAVTDPTGAYSFSGLPAGVYAVTATGISTLEGAKTIQVAVQGNDPTTASAIALTPVGTVTGKATLEGATDFSGILVLASGGGAYALTDSTGAYKLRGVVTGSHDVIFTKSGYATAVAPAQTITWNAETPVADTKLVPGDGAQTGTLTGTALLTGLVDHSGTTIRVGAQTTTAGKSGDFSLASLPAGTYTIEFKNGLYEERAPLFWLPNFGSFLLDDGALFPWEPITVPRASRLASGHVVYDEVTADKKRLVFITEPPGNGGPVAEYRGSGVNDTLWSTDLATGVTTQLATGVSDDAELSADSARVAYWSNTSYGDTLATLNVVGVAGGTPVRVAARAFRNAPISFGVGGKLVFCAAAASGTASRCDLTSFDLASSTGTTLATEQGDNSYGFAGGYAWFIDQFDGTGGALKIVELATGKITNVGTRGEAYNVSAFEDGAALLSYTANDDTLNIVTLATATVKKAGTALGGYGFSTRDGKTVLMLTGYVGQTATGTLQACTSAGACTQLGTNAVYNAYGVSPDDKLVYFLNKPGVSNGGNTALSVVAIGGGTPTVIDAAVGPDGVRFSPDSKSIAFFNLEDVNDDFGTLTIKPVAGGTAVQAQDVYRYGGYDFSPDSTRVAVWTGWDNSSRLGTLQLLAVAGGALTQIDTDSPLNHVFSEDGKRLAYVAKAAKSGGLGTLFLRDLAGGTSATIAKDASPVSISPDGAKLLFKNVFPDGYWFGSGDGTLNVVATTGGTATAVSEWANEVEWLGNGQLMLTRSSTPTPFGFQNGMYLAKP